MRLCIERSNDLAPLPPFPSWLDCTTNTSGYDFRKGQVAAVRKDAIDNRALDVTEAVIPNSGHWLMEEQPAATIAALRAFLEK